MSTCCRLLTALLAATFSITLSAQQPGGTITTSQSAVFTPDTTPPHGTYPEIVRLSLVQGDVRIARGKQDAKLTGNTWEQATTGIPLQSGFNLATGPNGRAEIEFEDASTIYLASNSALSFADLTTKDGIPHSTLSLLAGSITLHVKPSLPGDNYRIETPTDAMGLSYGDENFSRITSYLDGLQITPMDDTHVILNGRRVAAPAGTTYDLTGFSVRKSNQQPSPDLLAFDSWVKQRVNERDAAMRLVMKQAGLSTPLPGLADLAGKGTFVPCAPYGTCWQPNDGWVQQHSDTASTVTPQQNSSTGTPIKPLPESQRDTVSVTQLQQEKSQTPSSTTQSRASGLGIYPYDLYGDDFPCNPYELWYRRALLLNTLYYPADYYNYDWAVCHAGWWLYRNNHYVWVVSTRKHHRCPVHWVKYQGKLGYVPSHPRDRKGGVPVNLRHGIFQLSDKPNHPIDRVAFEGKSPPRSLEETPKDFRDPAPPLLARAASPELGVRFMHEAPFTNLPGSRSASSLKFDPNHERFVLTSRVTEGGRTHTFTAPMSNRGGHIAPASQGGYHPSSSGGAPTRASYGGGSAARSGGYSGGGGGSRGGGGGGYSGGGGGGHSSGGGSSSSSGGAASAGGGGHH